jgi:hypothetical protein
MLHGIVGMIAMIANKFVEGILKHVKTYHNDVFS